MKYEMKLNGEPFEAMKKGLKTVEMRLCDEKRSVIRAGDEIEFSHRQTGEKLATRVVNLRKFNSFEELYKCFDKSALGYEAWEIAHPCDMSKYYPADEIELYGALAIEIELI